MSRNQVDNNSNPINYWFRQEKSMNLSKALWNDKFQPNLEYIQKMQLFKLNFQQSKENMLSKTNQQQSIISQLNNFSKKNSHQKAQSIDLINKNQQQQNFSFQSSFIHNNNQEIINQNSSSQMNFQYTGTNNFSFKSFLDKSNNDSFGEQNNQNSSPFQQASKIQLNQNTKFQQQQQQQPQNQAQTKVTEKSPYKNNYLNIPQQQQQNISQSLTNSMNFHQNNQNVIKLQSTTTTTSNLEKLYPSMAANQYHTDRLASQQIQNSNLKSSSFQQENNIILNINQQSESSLSMSPKSFKLNLSINTKRQDSGCNKDDILKQVLDNRDSDLVVSPGHQISSQQFSEIKIDSNVASPTLNLSPNSKKRSSLVNYKKVRSFVKESKFKTGPTNNNQDSNNNQDNNNNSPEIQSPEKNQQSQQMSPQFSPFSKTQSEIPPKSLLKMCSYHNLYQNARNKLKTVKTEISEGKQLASKSLSTNKQAMFKKQLTFDVVNYVSDFKNKLCVPGSNVNGESTITRFNDSGVLANSNYLMNNNDSTKIKFNRKANKQLTTFY